MTDLDTRILVVCGARVLDAGAESRRWAKAVIARRMVGWDATLVAHGGARGPDTWADELAAWLGLPRVVFLPGKTPLIVTARGRRAIRGADRYLSTDPLSRNTAMMRWAADRAAEGHAVEVLALHAPWSTTHGTTHAVGVGRGFDLCVMQATAETKGSPQFDEGETR